ncbi:uncharacterized protein LOC126746321 [Anthonomus grandis grandis]|uniref:uncharacterized protein LOC126746321 n=1 Tax=Anthonomus grandis grandis TaxID=2921223 RepID=UPI00216519C2|nr:uncharacterized protein LOC126746321 [Anthonomus grandis grandis]XP_050310474.1 uncharacterized protein LOC126746321 [Anthonomus grandis grandis]
MNSPSTRNRERILEAIDQLRKRKARPDITRICNYLFRRFHINSAEAKSDLEWCVAHNVVLKVEYKGNISYRNAAKKWAQMRNRLDNNQHSPANNANSIAASKLAVSKNFMELLTNVFGELVVEEPDYLEIGVPPREIIENILSKDSVRYTRNYIAILLIKEVERGNLLKLENGNFLLGPCCADGKRTWTPKEPERKMITSSTSQTSRSAGGEYEAELNEYRHFRGEGSGHAISVQTEREESPPCGALVKPKKRMIAKVQQEKMLLEHRRRQQLQQQRQGAGDSGESAASGNLRYGGRRKKAKKVFDPSDNNIPKKRGRPAGSLNRATIEKQLSFNKRDDDSRPSSRTSSGSRDHGGVCSVCHTQSRKGPNDRMVSCRECSNKAHFGCLNGDDMMLRMYPDNTWQCPHCKTCVVCYETSDAGNLIVCSVCADGYHPGCHQPRVTEKIKNGQRWLCFNCQVTDKMKPKDIHIGESIGHEIKLSDENVDKEISSQSNSGRSSPYDSTTPASPTPPESPKRKRHYESSDRDQNSDSNSVKYSESEEIDPAIPDATHWTADEVYQYFARYFPEDAKVFKEQEIDGRSLLLLKRLDVLSSLNLKLGPALKIYRHVTMLQVRRDDRRLYWL